MKRTALVLALALAAGCAADPARAGQHGRDDQWIYRDPIDDSGPPVAVFLSWNYAAIIFRAYCDPKTREVVLEYTPDLWPEGPTQPIILSIGEHEFPMRTTWDRPSGEPVPAPMVGRLTVTQDLLNAWPAGIEIDIWAANDMGEAWHVGQAAPLGQVVRECAPKAP